MKRHVRRSKYEPLCDEVDLVAINPTHAQIRFPCGREAAVSLKHLAPLPMPEHDLTPDIPGPVVADVQDSEGLSTEVLRVSKPDILPVQDISHKTSSVPEPRRSARSNIGVPPNRDLDHGITY